MLRMENVTFNVTIEDVTSLQFKKQIWEKQTIINKGQDKQTRKPEKILKLAIKIQ